MAAIKVVNGRIGLVEIFDMREKAVNFNTLYDLCTSNYDKQIKRFKNVNLLCCEKMTREQIIFVLKKFLFEDDMLRRLELLKSLFIKKVEKRKTQIPLTSKEMFKKIRRHLNMNQEKFSEMLGISKAYCSELERGKHKVSPRVAALLKEKVNVDTLVEASELLKIDGSRLKEIRLSFAMTQKEFAKKMKMSDKVYYQVETGVKNITKKYIERLKVIKNEKCLLNLGTKLTVEKLSVKQLTRVRIAVGLDKHAFADKVGIHKATYKAIESGVFGISEKNRNLINDSKMINQAKKNISKKGLIDTLVNDFYEMKSYTGEVYTKEKMKEIRESLKLDSKQFANAAGINQRHYSSVEAGKLKVTSEITRRIKELEAKHPHRLSN